MAAAPDSCPCACPCPCPCRMEPWVEEAAEAVAPASAPSGAEDEAAGALVALAAVPVGETPVAAVAAGVVVGSTCASE